MTSPIDAYLRFDAAEDLDAHDLLGARVVGDVEIVVIWTMSLVSVAYCASRARSMSFSTRQRLSFDSGRDSTSSTRSPT